MHKCVCGWLRVMWTDHVWRGLGMWIYEHWKWCRRPKKLESQRKGRKVQWKVDSDNGGRGQAFADFCRNFWSCPLLSWFFLSISLSSQPSFNPQDFGIEVLTPPLASIDGPHTAVCCGNMFPAQTNDLSHIYIWFSFKLIWTSLGTS